MVAAISKDGFLTKGDDPNPAHFTSKEDKEHLSSLIKEYNLQVFGSKTYEAYKPAPDKNTLRVVLTHSPKKYIGDYVYDQMHFESLDPQDFIHKYSQDYDSCLLLGGGSVYRQFLDAGAVDEIYLTIEPVEHKSGISFLKPGETLDDLNLPEPQITTLNSSGTILQHYTLKN